MKQKDKLKKTIHFMIIAIVLGIIAPWCDDYLDVDKYVYDNTSPAYQVCKCWSFIRSLSGTF